MILTLDLMRMAVLAEGGRRQRKAWLKGALFFHSQCGKILAKLFLFPQFIL